MYRIFVPSFRISSFADRNFVFVYLYIKNIPRNELTLIVVENFRDRLLRALFSGENLIFRIKETKEEWERDDIGWWDEYVVNGEWRRGQRVPIPMVAAPVSGIIQNSKGTLSTSRSTARVIRKKKFFSLSLFFDPSCPRARILFPWRKFYSKIRRSRGGHVNNFDLAFCEFSNFFNRSLSSTIFFSFCINDSEKDEIVHT